MLADFARVLGGVTCHSPRIPVISGITGADLSDPGYWVAQVREPVRYHDMVTALQGQGVRIFAELGPAAT